MNHSTLRGRVAVAGIAAVVLAGSSVVGAADSVAATNPSGDVLYGARPPHVRADGLKAISPKLTPAECLAQSGGAFACQDPASIHRAYDIPTSVDGAPAGTGQTIVIVDAFGSPTVADDLAAFDSAFNLPAPPSFKVIHPQGKPTWTGTDNQVGWAEETSLDVQWAHAVAPGANIVLAVAVTNYGSALNNAVRYAVQHHLGNIISMSYGEPESMVHGNSTQQRQSHAIFTEAVRAGITPIASSGDDGSDNNAGYANFSYPANDPLVTAVGGTDLWAGSGLTDQRETTWGDYDPSTCLTGCPFGPLGATGGAPSLATSKQGSDVSYNAGVYTGVLTYLGFLGGEDNGFYYFGGTSAGTPQWAGIVAMVNQARAHAGHGPVGNLRDHLPTLATAGAFFDVARGSNETPTFPAGFSASTGKDAPTGYGSPDAAKVIATLR
jgi:subtilase family serine protease